MARGEEDGSKRMVVYRTFYSSPKAARWNDTRAVISPAAGATATLHYTVPVGYRLIIQRVSGVYNRDPYLKTFTLIIGGAGIENTYDYKKLTLLYPLGLEARAGEAIETNIHNYDPILNVRCMVNMVGILEQLI